MLLHHSQLQIIHSVKKWAALNWHVCKSAATGRESQKENSLASDVWLQSFKETNTQPFRGAGRGFISMTETAAIHLIMGVYVCCSPKTEIRRKKKKKMQLLALFLVELRQTEIWVFPVESSMNTSNKTENGCLISQYSNPLWVTNKVDWKLREAPRLRASSLKRHCFKATLGIRTGCDKFCQSKYGLINELA